MKDNRIYLVTGAAGFLGSNICLQLLQKGVQVRALVLPGDKSAKFIPSDVEIIYGDLCDAGSLDAFFALPEGHRSVVIHCASMVTVDPKYSDKLMSVNVGGTRNIITRCLAHPECEKLVYVSSTGAIPEQPMGTPIREVSKFDPCDPEKVVGAYSQSKAKATQMVLDAVKVMGLKACVVHPSGILGPNDHALGETSRTLLQIIKGEMPVGMQGSFNLCDVRDLAAGTIAAVDRGRIGECYILANETVTLKELCQMLSQECSCQKIKIYLPLGLADKIAQGLEKKSEKTGKKPLMTTFSVYNLARNNVFDYTKAKEELGYTTRPYQQTIHDEVQWMAQEGLIDGVQPQAPRTQEPEFSQPEVKNHTLEKVANAMTMDSSVTGPELLFATKESRVDTSNAESVELYKAVEHGVVGAYQTIEKGVVGTYEKIEDGFVDAFLRKEGETIQDAKQRLKQFDPTRREK